MAIEKGERLQILALVDRLIKDKVAPEAAIIDAEDKFPSALYAETAKQGLLGLWIPEEYGGTGPDLITPLIVSERFARVSCAFALIYSNCGDAVNAIVNAAGDHLKREWLPKIVSGEVIPCFSLSEPGAGSDVASLTTRAEKNGNTYIINGRKCWCTNGSVGGVYTLFAKTQPDKKHKGISAFLVPRDVPGLSVVRDEDLMGLRGSPTTELEFDNVRLPADHLIGQEGEGFRIAMIALDEARLNCAAMALGAGTAALNDAVNYAKERVQFDKPIIEHQGLQFKLAEMTAQMAAARSLWEESIAMLEAGQSKRSSAYAALTKYVCTEAAMKVTIDAVQVLGGSGLSKAHSVERYMRDVKAFQIFDGTNEIQKILIGRYLQKEGLPF